MMNVRVCVL